MQIKKYEASSLKDAIKTVKRELGPDAIILQTKTNKKGFGLLSDGSVEVTAAISEKSLKKKKSFEKRLDSETREDYRNLPASRMNKIYEKYVDQRKIINRKQKITEEKVVLSGKRKQPKELRARPTVPYVEIGRDTETSPTPAPKSFLQKTTKFFTQNTGSIEPSNSTLKLEINHLKAKIHQIETEKNHNSTTSAMKAEGFSSPVLTRIYELLLVNGVAGGEAYQLVKKVSFEVTGKKAPSEEVVSDQLASEIMESTETISLLDGVKRKDAADGQFIEPQMIAFVGPTGVGKTTTVAKIASDAVLNRKLRVGLINIDQFRIGAEEQLKTYSKILRIPMKNVGNEDQFNAAIRDYRKYDLILIDTTGRSQRDTDALNQQKKLLKLNSTIRTELVVSATTRDSELYDIGKRFSAFHPEGIIFSKLDEAISFGAIYNLSHRLKLPLIYFTTGQKVPEDIETATQERMAALLMDL